MRSDRGEDVLVVLDVAEEEGVQRDLVCFSSSVGPLPYFHLRFASALVRSCWVDDALPQQRFAVDVTEMILRPLVVTMRNVHVSNIGRHGCTFAFST